MTKKLKSAEADLKFGPGDLSGFTAAGVAIFHDLNPAKVIRELLQNSLDAAREAKRTSAIIRFEVKKHDISLVPGIGSYRSAFKQAVEYQKKRSGGTLPDTATGIVKAMEECLESRECETLFVLDNGIGLDKSRMQSLLADGLSIKGNEGTGAVGNGHLTIMPTSDLRYVLYGGRTEKGEIISSGHAILASHQQDNVLKSKDGFYVKDITIDPSEPYVFPNNVEIPDYIKGKLEYIKKTWEYGTVVAVPGFNHFREDDRVSLWDMVSKAAACNFFAAFADGTLCIELEEGGDKRVLNESNIDSTLKNFSEEKNTRSGFLSGSRSFTAFETIKTGEHISIDTDIGCISARYRILPQGGSSRVELCRNGMWITHKLPRLQYPRFADFKPFHCLILLEAKNGEVHRIVRKAEGPLHNNLEAKKWLSKGEKAALDKAMEAVFSKLKEIVPAHNTEEGIIEKVLTASSNGISSGGRGPGLVGRFQPLPPRVSHDQKDPDEGENTESGSGSGDTPINEGNDGGINRGRPGRGTFRRAGRAIRFGALPVPIDKRSYRVDLIPDEKTTGSEVRFALDESLDESCDVFGSEAFARLKNVKVDGRLMSEGKLTRNKEGRALGVRLGALDPGKRICIEFDYELPTGIDLSDDMPVVLKTQLVHRAPDLKNQEES